MEDTTNETVQLLNQSARSYYAIYNDTKLINQNVIFLSGTNERSQLFERPPWQKLVSIFMAELIGTAILMFFGCMGEVPKIADGQLGPYSGAIAFSGTVAVTIIVSILH